jgi:hypothetical protein
MSERMRRPRHQRPVDAPESIGVAIAGVRSSIELYVFYITSEEHEAGNPLTMMRKHVRDATCVSHEILGDASQS